MAWNNKIIFVLEKWQPLVATLAKLWIFVDRFWTLWKLKTRTSFSPSIMSVSFWKKYSVIRMYELLGKCFYHKSISFRNEFSSRLFLVFCTYRQLTDLEKIALRALRDELLRTDKAFCTLWNGVWHQFEAICNMDGKEHRTCLVMWFFLASFK